MNVRAIILIAVAVIGTLFPIASQAYGDRNGGWLMVDFRAYYCASLATREHADPYRTHPLHECESTTPAPFFRAASDVTVPAPYPTYALMVIAPLTFLPFTPAVLVWATLMALLCALAIFVLARVTGLPIFVTWAALALSLGLESLPSGQVVPLCIAALAVAAWLVQRGHGDFAALAVVLAMIEPHIALPAAIALYIRYPATRTVLLLGLTMFIAGSLVFGGAANNIEYFGAVLPAHALSEVSRDNQYSLSTIVANFGVPDARAILIGDISYFIMLTIGVMTALHLTSRFRDAAFIVLTPPAFALLGGPFVHSTEMAAALPLCLLLYARSEQRRNVLPVLAIVLIVLAIPWMSATSAALFLAMFFPAAYLVYVLGGSRTWVLGTACATGCVVLLLFVYALHPATRAPFVSAAHPPIDPGLAEYSWRKLVLGNSTNRPVTWLLRLPTWIGLVSLLALTLETRSPLIHD
jgi:hypothetical protein